MAGRTGESAPVARGGVRLKRRRLLIVLLALLVPLGSMPALGSEAHWLRAVVAVYRMIRATGTVSASRSAKRRPVRFSGVALKRPQSDPPRVTREEFAELADQHPLAVTKADRRRLDRNVWAYVVDSRLSRSDALHLDDQWGDEGVYLSLTVEANLKHVEDCRQCRSACQAVTRTTKLTCDFKETKPVFPRGITIPP